MANSKTQIVKRLEEIKDRAAHLASVATDKTAANLAEEAAGLGLELAALKAKKG